MNVCKPSAGAASANKAVVEIANAAIGLAITTRASFPQRRRARSRVRGNHGTGQACTRWPSRYSTAGRTIVLARMASTTTMMAATDIERMTGMSMMSRVANAAATVVPEATTVRPAVRSVAVSAVRRSRPALHSSMNRRITISE